MVIVILGVVGFAGYFIWRTQQDTGKSSTSNTSSMPIVKKEAAATTPTSRDSAVAAEFDKDVRLALHGVATYSDSGQTVELQITELEPASKEPCPELCRNDLPITNTKLTVQGKSYKGTAYGSGSQVDMSFAENGDYEKLPYTITIVDTDDQSYAVVRVHKK